MRYFMMSFAALGLGLSATSAANAQSASNAESTQGSGDPSAEQQAEKKKKKNRRVRKRSSTRLLGTDGSRKRAMRKARQRQAKQRQAQQAAAEQAAAVQGTAEQTAAEQSIVQPSSPLPPSMPGAVQPVPAARAIVRPGGFRVAPVMQLPGLQNVIGADATGLQRQFGAARLDVREGDARKLQFTGEPCVLDVYLYPPAPGAEPRATYVDARRASDGLDVDRASCVKALAAKR